jgi:hypothetical protein
LNRLTQFSRQLSQFASEFRQSVTPLESLVLSCTSLHLMMRSRPAGCELKPCEWYCCDGVTARAARIWQRPSGPNRLLTWPIPVDNVIPLAAMQRALYTFLRSLFATG